MALIMLVWTISSLITACMTSPMPIPQGQNTMKDLDPNAMTWSSNGTTFIIPIDKAKVQQMVPYPLLDVPVDDKTLFPTPFPQGAHPVTCRIEYENDVRLNVLSIPCLLAAICAVPYVKRLDNDDTPFNYGLRVLLSGCTDDPVANYEAGLVPTIVGSLEGNPILIGTFDPLGAPYKALPNGIFSASAATQLTPPIPGPPSIAPSTVDILFQDLGDNAPAYTLHTFHALANQATIISNGECVRNNEYSNQTFAEPHMRIGNVTLGFLSASLSSPIQGFYANIQGLSSSQVHVGQVESEDCATAAKENDPSASV